MVQCRGPVEWGNRMLKVLIVDDDQLLREDLKHLIDWGENGFRIVGEAANGQEALELLKNHEVDLVIADIHMPIVNGVDLIKKASQVYPWVKFLVISNYDDFVYVKEAMKYGAVDYILKYETEPDQLLPVLNNVKSVIANERQTTLALEKLYQLSAKGHSKMMEEFWGRLLFDREYCRSSAALSEANNLEIELSRSYFMVVLVELFSVEKNGEDHKSCFETIAEFIAEKQGFEHYVVHIGEQRWAVILRTCRRDQHYIKTTGTELAGNLMANFRQREIDSVVTVGDPCFSYKDLADYFKVIEKYGRDKFYCGFNTIITPEDFTEFNYEIDPEPFFDWQRQMSHALSIQDPRIIAQSLEDLFGIIRERRYYPDLTYDYFVNIILEMKKKLGLATPDPQEKSLSSHRLRELVTLEAIERWFTDYITALGQNHPDQLLRYHREEINRAVALIHSSYREELTLDYVADYVGLSKNYFCRVFKEETGETFISYLNRIRIEKAKLLMENTKYRSKEIAFAVGFKEYRYFSKVFRDFTRMNPAAYRKRLG